MAQGKTIQIKSIPQNKVASTATKHVELIVVNGSLVPDNNDVNPGVNSNTQK